MNSRSAKHSFEIDLDVRWKLDLALMELVSNTVVMVPVKQDMYPIDKKPLDNGWELGNKRL